LLFGFFGDENKGDSMLVLSFSDLQKWHLNVPLGLDSDEFVSRSVPIENFGHFAKKIKKIVS
jgi:hypothetical protein